MLNFNWTEQDKNKIMNNENENDMENSLKIEIEDDENYKTKTINNILKKRKKYSKNYKNSPKTLKVNNFDKIVKRSRVATEHEKNLILTEYEDMQVWVKTLLSIFGSLPNIIKVIDQIIENQATNPFGASHFCAVNTFGQIEKVIDFYERKNKLLNIYVLIQKLLEGLNDEEKSLINMKFVNKITIEAIAQNIGMERRNVYRKFNTLNKKLASFSLSKGWTTTFISNQLESEPWVAEQYNYFKKEAINSSMKTKLKVQ